MGRRHGRGRRRDLDPYVILLLLQIWQRVSELPDKPPVTVALIALQAWIHVAPMGPFDLDLEDVCMDPYAIVYQQQFHRLLLNTLYHVTDLHLYYNLSSFVLKGYLLERRYGSFNFLAMILFMAIASSTIYVSLAFGAYGLIGTETLVFSKAAGFSGVLFALKVVMHVHDEGEATVVGIQVPNKYIYWAELLLIQAMVPNASFMGHLSGILAGLAFVNVEALTGRPDFLVSAGAWKRMFDGLFANRNAGRAYRYMQGTTGRAAAGPSGGRHSSRRDETQGDAAHARKWRQWEEEQYRNAQRRRI